jgi:putative transposase
VDERRLGTIKKSVKRSSPLGDKDWSQTAAVKMNLESTLRQRGRPRKGTGGVVEKVWNYNDSTKIC